VREWAAEVAVDEALARRLIGAQFPDLEVRSLSLLGQGWDMTVWLVDDRWVFRFPRRERVIPGLINEIAHLPRLAPVLPHLPWEAVCRLRLALLRGALPPGP
jgi:aminoglycoside phosphotransferase (APT) family kinase protein